MNHKDEEKLLMIYLNEADKQDVETCMNSPEWCQRLDQLEADMQAIEHNQKTPALPDDYGQQLWNKIADKLVTDESTQTKPEPSGWLHKCQTWLFQPQFSLASLAGVMVLLMVAFIAGKQQGNEGINTELREQLLAQNIQLHLTQSEIFLTQVSNGTGAFNGQATAQRLLSSNRIFKQALAHYDGQFAEQILNDLEPILLEYANGAPTYDQSESRQQPQANLVNSSNGKDLMLQIKAMKQQLAKENNII